MTDTVDALDAEVESTLQGAISRALANLKGTVSFERKVNLGNYESVTASCFVQFDFDPLADDEDFLSVARQAMERASALVYEKLGIDCERDAAGTLREVVQSFPGATVEAPAASAAPTPQVGVGAVPPYTKPEIDALAGDDKKAAMRENNEWAEARFATHPQEFNDYRKSNAEKGWTSPDYKHKTHKHVGFWAPKN